LNALCVCDFVISEDGRKIAARFGELLTSSPTVTMAAGNA
jgi:hypothetical protein